jgi:hypothetical protein
LGVKFLYPSLVSRQPSEHHISDYAKSEKMEMYGMDFGAHEVAAPIEAKKNEFNPYQDNGGYVAFEHT